MTQRLLTILSLALLLLGATGFALARSDRLWLMSIQTDSMEPALQRGDLVVVKKVQANRFAQGDVISYHSSLQPSVVITHRVIAINPRRRMLIAKGDNGTVLEKVPTTSVIGVVKHAVPYCGHLLDFLRTLPGLIVLCYIPALAAVLSEMRLYEQARNQSIYRIRHKATG